MNYNNTLRNKGFINTAGNSQGQNLKKVAEVSVCLCEEHSKCTGNYIDYTKTYVIRCLLSMPFSNY